MGGIKHLGAWVIFINLAGLNGFSAARLTSPEALGSISGRESVRVNNERVLPGTTVFAGDVIQTGQGSSALVKFRTGTLASVSANSEVALSPDSTRLSLNLRHGAVAIESPGSQPSRVSVLGASVYVYGEGRFPAVCRIAAVGKSAAVFNDRGHVEIHGAGPPLILPQGKYAQLEAGKPQGGGQRAGKVSAQIPTATLKRGPAGETTLKLQDNINWEDLVKTLRTGRVRIEMLDGSFLNIGARSEMKIVRHDVQTQQTEVEMTVGRLRGEVVKLTKPGASFQVRTQTAVIGVVGTIFVITATAKMTRVTCIQGLVSVSNINPAIHGTTTLHAGQTANVAQGLPPTGAVQAASSEIQTEMNQTNVGGPAAGGPGTTTGGGQAAPGAPTTAAPTAPTGVVAPAPTGVVGVANTVTTAASTAASATSVGISTVAITRVDDAQSALTTATATLDTAQTDNTQAVAAANLATVTAQGNTTAVQNLIQLVASPSQPCGCF